MAVAAAVAIATDLDDVPEQQFDEWCRILPAVARRRAAAFGSFRRYRHFVAGRNLLAQLLATGLDRDFQSIITRLSDRSDGRPCLTGSKVYCSISHSGSAVMAGFSQLAPIGVDIEQHRPRDFQRLVREYFHPDEYRAFEDIEPEQQSAWFYRLWTRKEAAIKASGEGLTLKSLRIPDSFSDAGSTRVTTCCLDHFTLSVAHLCSHEVLFYGASFCRGELQSVPNLCGAIC